MTYEEYKNNKKETSSRSIFKSFMSKLFTIVIFTMLVIIISNYSPKFRDFITNKVLNSTIDFSFINKFMNRTTDVFKKEETKKVFKEETKHEKYKDGIKIFTENDTLVSSICGGIVVYVGDKDDYGNSVIIQGNDGVDYLYGNLHNLNINLYDYIENDTLIGSTRDNYMYLVLFHYHCLYMISLLNHIVFLVYLLLLLIYLILEQYLMLCSPLLKELY